VRQYKCSSLSHWERGRVRGPIALRRVSKPFTLALSRGGREWESPFWSTESILWN